MREVTALCVCDVHDAVLCRGHRREERVPRDRGEEDVRDGWGGVSDDVCDEDGDRLLDGHDAHL